MFALRGRKTRLRAPLEAADLDGQRVLPRPLRRVVRFLVSLGTGRIHFMPHTGTISAAAFLAATGFYGMSLGGHSQNVAQATTSAVGFAIEDVKVSGNDQTSEIDILQQLGLDGTTSLVALDIDVARKLISEMPWVQDVAVRKVYPGTIEVTLKERRAFGIWQHGSDLSLIEESGSVIAPLRDNKFSELPLFVGRDAETSAAEFYAGFSQWPEISKRVKAYVRVAGRRWDLMLDNGITIKLPEHDIDRAMQVLSTMEEGQQLLERDIAAVDLRLEDRTTIQLTKEAAARRDVALEARTKKLKKLEQESRT
ncbi:MULTISPECIES: cell division protein FtsQ/DivIB [unclassified Rhizobium]|uniref:cell division protein FtsQ/DivIB n=1 Tax=unclassified Rhizobium TaxID=2613769 RepID=UPI0007145FA5|nr:MULTISPECIES: cell division protein FtsQ/DivIB [unclassified Rhizobium]KQS97888.1 cell division protein FtsQ [Rhizobium sp. Leaf386]KQT00146.1 cell division protein FtsQ [Rhizobium sp. Leaf391]KQT97152.1 cell division protein FtsQ [Rhizobium sp. Leaf453]